MTKALSVLLLTMVFGAAGLIVGVSPAAASATTARGYELVDSRVIGISPTGFKVYVEPQAPHHVTIANSARLSVADFRARGLNVTWAGYGNPATADGIVNVVEANSGCKAGTSQAALTTDRLIPLPGGNEYVSGATVAVCPALFKSAPWQWEEVVRHELGHTVGLGHFNGTFAGKSQTMRSVTSATAVRFQSGDINGLNYLAAGKAAIARMVYPAAHYDGVARLSPTVVHISGWSFVSGMPAAKVSYYVTDNGKSVGSFYNKVSRPDVNKAFRITGTNGLSFNLGVGAGKHTICLTAVTTSPLGTVLGCKAV